MSVLIVKKPSESNSRFVGRGAYKDNRGAKSLFWVGAHRSVPGGPPGQSDPGLKWFFSRWSFETYGKLPKIRCLVLKKSVN